MINLLLKPQINLLDVLLYAVLLGLYMKGSIGLLLFMILCVVSGAVGAVVQNRFLQGE